ncbi:tyrosine-type recombinase/integrase [Leptospirillum ferriphilum]|uniref:tyrosine-type recombinase/integrase n=1 Tax=Leptospirillum ferriphilum TaxID=178606 RepID=UPI003EE7073D
MEKESDKVFSFTKTSIERLTPTGKRERYRDTEKPGLYLDVSPSGKKTFYWCRRLDRKVEWVRIGTYPAVFPETARKRVDDLNTQAALGINPAQEKRKKREAQTFGEIFDAWLYESRDRGKKSWGQDEKRYKRHGQPFAKIPPAELTRDEIKRLHMKIKEKSGLYEANRTLALLRAVLAWGIREYGWEFPNPAQGIRMFREEKRDRWLQPHEMQMFFWAVREEENPHIRDFVITALLTGARKANVLSMAWKDLDLDEGRWRIPETKAGEPQVIPLHPQLVELLRERKKFVESPFFVFPSGPQGTKGHMVEPKAGWKRILERAGLKDLRIHDLRRTLGSWLATQGESLPLIGKALGHKSTGSTAVYSRLALDPVRAAMTKAVDRMLGFERDDENNATPFRKKK